MQVAKFTIAPEVFHGLPPDQQSAFLILGLLVNDANWMQKLLLICTLDETGGEPEEKARLALALSLSKSLAGKVHEGWIRLTQGSVAIALESLPNSQVIRELRTSLSHDLAKGSLIHKIRVGHGAHYPTHLSVDALPNIARDDIAIFMTEHMGDSLSLISELAAVSTFMDLGAFSNPIEALDAIVKEIVRVVGVYCEYLHALLVAVVDTWMPDSVTVEDFSLADAPVLDQVRLRFFAKPPARV